MLAKNTDIWFQLSYHKASLLFSVNAIQCVVRISIHGNNDSCARINDVSRWVHYIDYDQNARLLFVGMSRITWKIKWHRYDRVCDIVVTEVLQTKLIEACLLRYMDRWYAYITYRGTEISVSYSVILPHPLACTASKMAIFISLFLNRCMTSISSSVQGCT